MGDPQASWFSYPQVYADFEMYGRAVGLASCCVYGGAPLQSQITSLKRGVDVVVGTPGRVKDLLEKGCLNLGSLLFRVLDEADEMLRMGFVDDVELSLGKVDDATKVQTLLFSATLPDWVKQWRPFYNLYRDKRMCVPTC